MNFQNLSKFTFFRIALMHGIWITVIFFPVFILFNFLTMPGDKIKIKYALEAAQGKGTPTYDPLRRAMVPLIAPCKAQIPWYLAVHI